MSNQIVVVGGGVFGMMTAIELARRQYYVTLLESGSIPNPLAASTDITKVVRMEYGADSEYFKMAEKCIDQWNEWNEILEEDVYKEIGFLMLSKHDISKSPDSYEAHSLKQLIENGYAVQRFKNDEIQNRYPSIARGIYAEAIYNPHGGYVSSGRAISLMADYARSIGVSILEEEPVTDVLVEKDSAYGVKTKKGNTYTADHIVIAAGAHTPLIIKELRPYFKITGHPIYWLKPSDPQHFKVPHLPVFMADITNTGYYGFPYLEEHGIVKIAKHAAGIELDPENDKREVYKEDISDMRAFVKEAFPSLDNASITYTRRCLYTDTLDGHYWIDRHPRISGLTISTGGSGHGMKMGPEIGRMTADVVEGKDHGYSDRYRWRDLTEAMIGKEEARLN